MPLLSFITPFSMSIDLFQTLNKRSVFVMKTFHCELRPTSSILTFFSLILCQLLNICTTKLTECISRSKLPVKGTENMVITRAKQLIKHDKLVND